MKFSFNIVLSFAILLCCNSCLFKSNKGTKNKLTDSEIICRTKSISLKYLNIKKIDTFIYEEGRIYNIFTNDNSIITFLCGNNADIMTSDDYKLLDSTKTIFGDLSLRGINEKSGLFWRKDGIVGYERVKKKDTSKYNKIFNDKNFIKARSY